MSTLYSTKVTATGGGHGQIRSEDGLLDMKLALPRQLGSKGDATNPEAFSKGAFVLSDIGSVSGAPRIKGEVDSIARGIGDTQNSTGSNLLQNVNASFEWVRLAQRIPVRIKLINVPKDTILPSGMTVTVSIIQGTSSKKERIAEIQ
jgi:hypothetical protein